MGLILAFREIGCRLKGVNYITLTRLTGENHLEKGNSRVPKCDDRFSIQATQFIVYLIYAFLTLCKHRRMVARYTMHRPTVELNKN